METDGFAEIKKSMSREEIAVLDLVIVLGKQEMESAHSPEKTVIRFEGGRNANQIIRQVQNGDKSELPVPPKEGGFTSFGWTKIGTRDFQGEAEEYTVAGSSDIRIIHNSDSDSLKLFANTSGSFSGMESDFDSILNQINYPITAQDRSGFVFENNAFLNSVGEI